MNCLPCLRGKTSEGKKSDEKKPDDKEDEEVPVAQPKENQLSKQPSVKKANSKRQDKNSDDDGCDGEACAIVPPKFVPSSVPVAVKENIAAPTTTTTEEPPTGSAHTFKFQELASATKNFNRECLLGESGFGKVYKGNLNDGKVVAVKQLVKLGTKENKEFIEEVTKLSDLKHPNLVELIGYCADGDQRLLVYEYMPMGSIKHHIHDLPIGKKPLDWITRIKAAAGAAQAMQYLHETANPPVICRNVKSTNILLDENFKPKVADYGLVNLESSSGSNVQQRVVGTVGCAPEYEGTGELSLKSDVYSFGVVLLELITGRKAMDTSRPKNEQNLVSWAQPYFKDPKRFQELADPIFKGVVPEQNLNQAVGVAALCLQEESSIRPLISDIVGALNFLTVAPPEELTQPPVITKPTHSPPKKYPSSSSSSSSSDSESDREPDIKIEPFNRPEPKPRPEHNTESESEPEPESEPDNESEQEPEWESEPETETEPEPEQEPEPEPERELEPDFTDSDSDSDSDSELETTSMPEPVIEPVSKPKPILDPEPLPNHDDQPGSDHGSDSSGSIYEEDVYSEEDFSDEDKPSTSILINSRSKARMKVKSSKKKVMFKTEGTDSIKPNMKRINSSYSKQSFNKSKGNDEISRNTKIMSKSESRGSDHSDTEFTDGSEDEFETQRFKSTISRFSAYSRSYSGYQDENVHGSSSGDEE